MFDQSDDLNRNNNTQETIMYAVSVDETLPVMSLFIRDGELILSQELLQLIRRELIDGKEGN